MVERGGIRKAARALSYLAAWLMASNDAGHPVNQAEFMVFWRSTLSTSTRDRNAVRACLPDGWDFDRLHEFVWDNRRAALGSGSVARREIVMGAVSELYLPEAA
jgi:hypothetical protein